MDRIITALLLVLFCAGYPVSAACPGSVDCCGQDKCAGLSNSDHCQAAAGQLPQIELPEAVEQSVVAAVPAASQPRTEQTIITAGSFSAFDLVALKDHPPTGPPQA